MAQPGAVWRVSFDHASDHLSLVQPHDTGEVDTIHLPHSVRM